MFILAIAIANKVKMFSRPALRTTNLLARRGAHQVRNASFYHYPEGPRNNIPFNPKTRFFWLRYWGFCGMIEPLRRG